MEQVLGRIRGVGQVQVMLTLKSGSSLQLAENRSDSLRDTEARQERDGVPFPVEVTLDIPRSPALAEVIETDLGIDEDCQHWQETE